MSNLPVVKRLMIEDFTDVQGDWIQRLLDPINSFNEQVYNILNKGISITDNLQGTIATVDFTTRPDYVVNQTFDNIQINWKFRVYPRVLLLGNIKETAGGIIKSATGVTDWVLVTSSEIQIRFITGLKDNTKYSASFLIL